MGEEEPAPTSSERSIPRIGIDEDQVTLMDADGMRIRVSLTPPSINVALSGSSQSPKSHAGGPPPMALAYEKSVEMKQQPADQIPPKDPQPPPPPPKVVERAPPGPAPSLTLSLLAGLGILCVIGAIYVAIVAR